MRMHGAGFLHVHQGVHSDATWHVMAADEHDAEVDVAQGMPLRNTIPPTAAAHASPVRRCSAPPPLSRRTSCH